MATHDSGQNGGTTGAFSGWLAGEDGGAGGPVQLAQAAGGGAALGEPIGQIDTLQGDATIIRADGAKVAAAKGVPVYQGDQVATGKTGNLGIVFADKSTFALGRDGQMTLDEMVYDPATAKGKMAVNVAEGVFSFVSGQIAKTGVEAMMVKTPVATIGVRGTSGTGKAGAEGKPNSFSLLPDPDGKTGEATFKTSVGFETLSQPFASTSALSKFNPPTFKTILPANVVQKAFGDVAKTVNTYAATQNFAAAGSAAQNQAAARAFEQAVAQGKSPAEAVSQASNSAANVAHVEKWDKIGIGPYANQAIAGNVTRDILDAQTGKAQGGLGTDKDPLGAGRGGAADFGAKAASVEKQQDEGEKSAQNSEKEVKEAAKGVKEGVVNAPPATLAQTVAQGFNQMVAFNNGLSNALVGVGVGGSLAEATAADVAQTIANTFKADFAAQTIGNAMNDTIAPSIFNDNGAIKGEALGAFVNAVISQSQAIFDTVMTQNFFQNAGIQGPGPGGGVPDQVAQFINQVVTQNITQNVISQGTTNVFADTLAGTTGGDNLTGGEANTRIVMRQGTSLGGSDAVNGGGGTDEIALLELHSFQGIYDSVNKTITYSNSGGTITGTITLTSIEQIFVGAQNDAGTAGATYQGLNTGISSGGAATDSLNSGVRLKFESGDARYGYVLAGAATADDSTNSLTLAHGTSLNYNGMGHSVASTTTFGGVIFGRGGNDAITGSPTGDMIVLGGAGDDTVNLSLDTSQNSGAGQAHALYGEEDNDTFIFSTLASGFYGAIVGGTGTDIIQTGVTTINLGGSTFGFLGVETIKGTDTSASATTITVRDGILASEGGYVTTIDVSGSGGNSILQSSDATLNVAQTTLDSEITVLKAGTLTSAAGTIGVIASQVSGISSFVSGASGGIINVYGGGTVDFSGKTMTNFTYYNGAALADTITTGTGTDILDGAAGNDQLKGGNGSDVYTGGTGANIIDLSNTAGSAVDGSADTVRYDTTSDGQGAGSTTDTIKWFDTSQDILSFKTGTAFGLSATTFTGSNYLELVSSGLSNGGGFTSAIDVIVVTDSSHTKAQIDTALASGVSTSGNNPGAVFVIYTSSETSNTMLAYDSAAGTDGGGVTNIASLHVDASADVTASNLSDANFAVHS